jgi:hypothetical protein
VVLERMLSGVSTRQYRRVQDPVGSEVEAESRSTSTSAVSRTFVSPTRDQPWKLMNRPLADLSDGGGDDEGASPAAGDAAVPMPEGRPQADCPAGAGATRRSPPSSPACSRRAWSPGW